MLINGQLYLQSDLVAVNCQNVSAAWDLWDTLNAYGLALDLAQVRNGNLYLTSDQYHAAASSDWLPC